MTQDRRTFLKTTALAGAVAASGVAVAQPAAAQTAARRTEHMPRGLTFATIKRETGYGLCVRTERGILDVAAAERDFHENAPTTIDAVFRGEGDVDGLKRLADKAGASGSAAKYFVAADKATFGPCVTNPEKIVCVGLNYRCGSCAIPAPISPRRRTGDPSTAHPSGRARTWRVSARGSVTGGHVLPVRSQPVRTPLPERLLEGSSRWRTQFLGDTTSVFHEQLGGGGNRSSS